MPIASLGLAEQLVQVGVRERDRRLVGEALEEVQLVGRDLARRAVRDRECPDDLAGRRPERRRGHAPQPQPLGGDDVVRLVRDPRVDEVVVGPDRADLLGGEAVDPATEREPHLLEPALGLVVHAAGDDHRDEERAVLADPRQVGAVRAEQAARLLDDAGKDLAGIAQRGDPGGDVAQRAFPLRARLEGGLGSLQLLDEAGVRHGDRGLVGQDARGGRRRRRRTGSAGRRRRSACRALPAPRRAGAIASERSPTARATLVLVGRVLEPGIVEVVGREQRRPLGERSADDVLADERIAPAEPPLLVDPRVVAPLDPAGHRVEQVDDRAVGVQQAGGLLDDVLEQVAGLADRGDPGGDLAQALLGLGAPGDLLAGPAQLLDQPGVLDRDRGLVRRASG